MSNWPLSRFINSEKLNEEPVDAFLQVKAVNKVLHLTWKNNTKTKHWILNSDKSIVKEFISKLNRPNDVVFLDGTPVRVPETNILINESALPLLEKNVVRS